uniref:Capsid protein n=1 Tax=Blattella germanica permutotetra-like virus 1 TaxID=3133504 RepID=A0AAT9JA00_9VIRU
MKMKNITLREAIKKIGANKKYSLLSGEQKKQVKVLMKCSKNSSKDNGAQNKGSKNSKNASLVSRETDAPVARNVSLVAKQQQGVGLSGSDRIMFIEDISTVKARSIVAQAPVVPSMFPRLKQVSRAFHRIRYLSLVFEVVPQVGTSTAGGYILSFVQDVTESVPNGEEGLRVLFSQKGAVAAVDWQPSTMRVGTTPDLYYTEWNADEPRWSSPGKIVLATDGKASQKGSVAIYCHWKVKLLTPEYELSVDKGEVVVGQDIGMKAGSKNLGVGKDYEDDHNEATWQEVLPGVKLGTVLKMPFVGRYLKNESNAVSGMVGFQYILRKSDSYVLPLDDSYQEITFLSFGSDLIIPKGTILQIVKDKSENLITGSEYLCYPCSFGPFNFPSSKPQKPSISSLEIPSKENLDPGRGVSGFRIRWNYLRRRLRRIMLNEAVFTSLMEQLHLLLNPCQSLTQVRLELVELPNVMLNVLTFDQFNDLQESISFDDLLNMVCWLCDNNGLSNHPKFSGDYNFKSDKSSWMHMVSYKRCIPPELDESSDDDDDSIVVVKN